MVGDPEKSLDDGVILPWTKGGARMVTHYNGLLKGSRRTTDRTWPSRTAVWPSASRRRCFTAGRGGDSIFIHRAGKETVTAKPFEDFANLSRLFDETSSETTRRRLRAFMSPQACESCGGQRLREEVLAVTLSSEHQPDGESVWRLSIMDVCRLSIDEALVFFGGLQLDELGEKIAADVIGEITSRLRFLQNVGLGYLTLNRTSGTLSEEAQRIRLATQIGAGLVGVLYILDEPSIGLHARDNEQLLKTLEGLRDLGNTVGGRARRGDHPACGSRDRHGAGRRSARRRGGRGRLAGQGSGRQEVAHGEVSAGRLPD